MKNCELTKIVAIIAKSNENEYKQTPKSLPHINQMVNKKISSDGILHELRGRENNFQIHSIQISTDRFV